MTELKRPVLLDSAYRPAEQLEPFALSVREEAGGIATASMTLPSRPQVGVGSAVRLWNGAGEDLGVFRVTRAVSETGHGGRQKVELEHTLASLCDCVLSYAVSSGTSVSRAVRVLMSAGGAPMTLGDAEVDAAMTRVNFAYVTVWEAVRTVLGELPEGWRLEVSPDTSPWTLHIRAAEAAPCVLSANRNLLSLNCETDLTDYCSRLYPIGKDGLTVRGVNGGDPWVQSSANPPYGIASRMFMRPDVELAADLKALALDELARRSVPVVSVRAAARDLSAETGEDGDRFSLGRLCVIPTAELSGAWPGDLRFRVMTRFWPDLVRDPAGVILTLGNRRPRFSAALPATGGRSKMYE